MRLKKRFRAIGIAQFVAISTAVLIGSLFVVQTASASGFKAASGDVKKCKDIRDGEDMVQSRPTTGTADATSGYRFVRQTLQRGDCRNDPGYSGPAYVLTSNGVGSMQVLPVLAPHLAASLIASAAAADNMNNGIVMMENHQDGNLQGFKSFSPDLARSLASDLDGNGPPPTTVPGTTSPHTTPPTTSPGGGDDEMWCKDADTPLRVVTEKDGVANKTDVYKFRWVTFVLCRNRPTYKGGALILTRTSNKNGSLQVLPSYAKQLASDLRIAAFEAAKDQKVVVIQNTVNAKWNDYRSFTPEAAAALADTLKPWVIDPPTPK